MRAAAFVLISASLPAAADPLGLVDYDALMAAHPDRTICQAGRLCTLLMPDGTDVQQDADGTWLRAGSAQSAGSFALGFALVDALRDQCPHALPGIEAQALNDGQGAMLEAYQLSVPERAAADVIAAWQALRARLADYVAAEPDLAACRIDPALAQALSEMTARDFWEPELTALRETPTLPTANFTIP